MHIKVCFEPLCIKRYYADDKLELLTKKGIYPYEYMDTPKKLKET